MVIMEANKMEQEKNYKEVINKPIHAIKVGNCYANVWENKSVDGKKFFTIGIKKRYCDDSGEWHDSHNLTSNDLPKMIHALHEAYGYLMTKESD